MADYSGIINEKIVRKIWRKLYNIICEHIKNFDEENVMEHIEMFMEGVSWATGLRYEIWRDGIVYVYLNRPTYPQVKLYRVEYNFVIDVYLETKILRNSVNRHYAKQDILKWR